MAKWQDIIGQFHESIKAQEEHDEYAYRPDWLKTPAMIRWEKRFNERIDVGLRTYPLICRWYPRLCTRVVVSRCFYHRYGQIDVRISRAWKVILRMANPNPWLASTLKYMQDKKRSMDAVGKKQIPCVLTRKDVLVIIQALSMVPEDVKLEQE